MQPPRISHYSVIRPRQIRRGSPLGPFQVLGWNEIPFNVVVNMRPTRNTPKQDQLYIYQTDYDSDYGS